MAHGPPLKRVDQRNAETGARVALRRGLGEQSPPHVDPRQLVLTSACASRLCASRLRRCWRGRPGSGAAWIRSAAPRRVGTGVFSATAGRPAPSRAACCLAQLSGEVLQCLVVAGGFRVLVGDLDRSSRSNRENIEYRESDRHAGRPVGTVEAQSVRAAKEGAGRVNATSPPPDSRLQIQFRVVGAIQNTNLGMRLLDPSVLRRGKRVGCEGSCWWSRARRCTQQTASLNLNPRICDTKDVCQCRSASCLLLLRFYQVHSSASKFRICT